MLGVVMVACAGGCLVDSTLASVHCADLKHAQCSTFRWGRLNERPKDGCAYNYDNNNPLLQQHSQ